MQRKEFQILLVEDNPADVELVKMAIQRGNINATLHLAWDGVKAMSFLRKEGPYINKPTPNLVLLDISIPLKNGHEVLEEIRDDANLTVIPVVVLTTSNNNEDILRSYKQGARGYITKPDSPSELITAMKILQDYWISLVKLPFQNLGHTN